MSKFQAFFKNDAAPGIVLVVAALLAMIVANTPLFSFYQASLNFPIAITLGDFEIAKPLFLWVNDGLMAIFFFLVGLEIKREILSGHLSEPSQVTLPAIAAIAGIAAPAVIYISFNGVETAASQGWAIPSATDIAFALGIFILFGKSLPISLKLFLLSVAIFDDIGAIIIIALFYSHELSTLSLAIAGFGLTFLFIINRLHVRAQSLYLVIGLVVWAAVLKSGVHATLAGFAIAWFIPLKLKNFDGHAMLPHLEHALHPWVSFFVLPVFAFANAGVSLSGAGLEQLLNPITLGIAVGLFVGKQIGIFGACWLAIKAGLTKLPKHTTWIQLYGVSCLCGIGFTMSLFIGTLAFEGLDESYLLSVKVGVLMGSLVSASIGGLILTRAKPLPA